MKMILVYFILIFIFGSSVRAAEMIQFGENTRSYGMGGVRVSNDSEAYAFLYNPAHLAYVKGLNWEVFNMELSTNAYSKYEQLKGVDLTGINSISSLYGQYIYAGSQAYTALAFPYFGFAAYDTGYVDFLASNPAFPVIDMNFVNDYAMAMGGALPLGPNAAMGINFKRINRRGGPLQVGASMLNSLSGTANLLNQFTNEGAAYGIDAGLIYKAPAPLNPMVSLAWQDLGSTSFTTTAGTSSPERIKDNLTLGLSFEADTLFAGFAGGIEYRHITDAEEQLGKKIHMGLEMRLLMLDFRTGLYQGYRTYGVGMNLFLFQIDAAAYSVERGAYTGQLPDDRYQVGISMKFGFDPDFNLTDVGGKRRQLKQRR